MRSCRLLLIFVLSVSVPAKSPPRTADPDEGMEGSIRLGIPEPMVFDLVRPLGAAKGEFEINTLFRQPLSGERALRWAPEVEYAFRKGTAVEFELPVTGRSVQEYKAALQQKLPAAVTRRFTHGLQGIGEVSPEGNAWRASGLYLYGRRWHEKWSSLSMGGASRERSPERIRSSVLANHAVFHERWTKTALGLEFNFKHPLRSRTEWLAMPQIHFRLFDRVNLQLGAGYAARPGERSALVSWRLIREL